MFKIISSLKRNHILILLLILLLSVSVMRYFDSFLITDVSKNGILSFELAKEPYISGEIIESWDATAKAAAGLSLGFDFLFLLIYASFLSILIYKISKKLFVNITKKSLNYIIVATPFIAAFFDVIENIALIKLLLGDLQLKWSLTAYYAAVIKFGILFLVIGYVLIGGLISLIKK